MTLQLRDNTTSDTLLQGNQPSIVSLGIHLNVNNSETTQYQTLIYNFKRSLFRVMSLKGSVTLKLNVIRTAFFLALTYRLQHMQWPLKLYGLIKKLLQHYLYKILKLYNGFPSALIYLLTSLGGIELPDISTRALLIKLNIITRHQNADSTVKYAIDSLLARTAALNGTPMLQHVRINIPPPLAAQQPLWNTSMLQTLDKVHLLLTKKGEEITSGTNEPLFHYSLNSTSSA